MWHGQSLAGLTMRSVEVFTVVALIYMALTYPQTLLVNWLHRRSRGMRGARMTYQWRFDVALRQPADAAQRARPHLPADRARHGDRRHRRAASRPDASSAVARPALAGLRLHRGVPHHAAAGAGRVGVLGPAADRRHHPVAVLLRPRRRSVSTSPPSCRRSTAPASPRYAQGSSMPARPRHDARCSACGGSSCRRRSMRMVPPMAGHVGRAVQGHLDPGGHRRRRDDDAGARHRRRHVSAAGDLYAGRGRLLPADLPAVAAA